MNTRTTWQEERGHAGTPTDHRVKHRGGIPWNQVPMPPRWHFCVPHTAELWDEVVAGLHGPIIVLTGEFRCACGGRLTENGWRERNSRRQIIPHRVTVSQPPRRRSEHSGNSWA